MVKTRSSTRVSKVSIARDEESQQVIMVVEDDSPSTSTPNMQRSSKSKKTTTKTPNKKRKYRSGQKSNKNGDGAKVRKNGTILAYFKVAASPATLSSSSSDSEDFTPETPEKEPKKIKIDPKTRQFLESGVPDVVIKAQKCVEKKKIEDDYLSVVEFYPKIQQIPAETLVEIEIGETNGQLPPGFVLVQQKDENCRENDLTTATVSDYFHQQQGEVSSELPHCRNKICCRSNASLVVTDEELTMISANPIPWIEEERLADEGLRHLCCDKQALSKLTSWLKEWKSDIKDDGGTSRKNDLKKKKRDSEDDFITSDENEENLKKKSVLLTGPPGCGKTSAVYAAAKHYGFHVVEVNFSSRRAGKDVLQNVEEAVLSHRLKSGQNCLLLFEDIDLVDQKEDEGFHAAVARLITNSVRPIVMTTSCLGQLSLDPKLEKKEPLVIQFDLPNASLIVRKVLRPMVLNRASAFSLDEEQEDGDSQFFSRLSRLLDSICRHGRNDIRQVINQTQFIFTFSSSSNTLTSTNVHHHSIQSDLLLDLGFIQSLDEYNGATSAFDMDDNSEDCDENDLRLSAKARSRKCLEKLNAVSEMLNFVCDLNVLDSTSVILKKTQFDEADELPMDIRALKCNYFDPNFCVSFSNCCESGVSERVAQSLVLDTDVELTNIDKGYKLFDEIGEYCDNIYSEGGWECAAYVRSIIKRNMVDSVGRLAKRNGRITSYFNRLDRAFTTKICESLVLTKN